MGARVGVLNIPPDAAAAAALVLTVCHSWYMECLASTG